MLGLHRDERYAARWSATLAGEGVVSFPHSPWKTGLILVVAVVFVVLGVWMVFDSSDRLGALGPLVGVVAAGFFGVGAIVMLYQRVRRRDIDPLVVDTAGIRLTSGSKAPIRIPWDRVVAVREVVQQVGRFGTRVKHLVLEVESGFMQQYLTEASGLTRFMHDAGQRYIEGNYLYCPRDLRGRPSSIAAWLNHEAQQRRR